MRKLGQLLQDSSAARAGEIVVVALVALLVVSAGWKLVGADPFRRQAVVWVANVLMLLTVWSGLRLRGQGWSHLGLRLRWTGPWPLARGVLQSVAVFVAAAVAFVAGAVVMQASAGAAAGPDATSSPAEPDTSSYDWLQGNLPALLLALAAVYVVSSFGEEVLYRGFLITRLTEMGKSAKFAPAAAVVASSIVFGLVHFDWGLAGIVQTAFMGLALGLGYVFTKRNLWALVLAHGYLDTALLVQMYAGGGR